ncbi:hypothetical protein AHAS_Ahas16G0005500 [Arachis hypogaea]
MGSHDDEPCRVINLVLKGTQNLSILALVRATYYRLNERNEVFEVREMPSGRMLVVDLARRMCACGHFQVEQLPCHHVIACCAN